MTTANARLAKVKYRRRGANTIANPNATRAKRLQIIPQESRRILCEEAAPRDFSVKNSDMWKLDLSQHREPIYPSKR